MNIKTYISDLDISEGDSMRSDCPSCRGRKTFTVTKMDGKILYNCYKLGCNTRGVEATGYTKREIGERLSRLKDDTPSVDDFVCTMCVMTELCFLYETSEANLLMP